MSARVRAGSEALELPLTPSLRAASASSGRNIPVKKKGGIENLPGYTRSPDSTTNLVTSLMVIRQQKRSRDVLSSNWKFCPEI